MKLTTEVVSRVQKFLIATVATVALVALTTAISPIYPMTLLALGATPSSMRVPNVTTTSAAVFVQLGWNRLECSSDVYYKVVATSSTAVTASTGTLLRGPQGGNGLPQPAWILVSSDQWLALLLRSGSNAQCIVETVSLDGSAGSFTTLAVSSTSTFTGRVQFDGFIQGQDAGFNNIVATGNASVTGTTSSTGNFSTAGTASVAGALTSGGVISGIFDGGAGVFTTVNTSARVTAASLAIGASGIVATPTTTGGSCTLNGASPSTCTATVLATSKCLATAAATAANNVLFAAVSGTTLTVTGPNGGNTDVNYFCFLP